jgi:hypothetical protein
VATPMKEKIGYAGKYMLGIKNEIIFYLNLKNDNRSGK